MKPFHQCLALGPVAIYMVLLGVINLARRPLVVSGGRDAAALGLAVSGLVFVGPISLLFPESIAAHFGPAGTKYIWLMFVGLMAICLIMVLLVMRPRLIIYNISADQFRPILAEVVERMDAERPLGRRLPVLAGARRATAPGDLRLDAERVARLFRPEAGLPGLVAAGG